MRASSFVANSSSLPETSRRKVAVRRSVSGAILRQRSGEGVPISASMRRPISSNLSMFTRLSACNAPPPEVLTGFGYYRTLCTCCKEECLALPYQWQYRVKNDGRIRGAGFWRWGRAAATQHLPDCRLVGGYQREAMRLKRRYDLKNFDGGGSKGLAELSAGTPW